MRRFIVAWILVLLAPGASVADVLINNVSIVSGHLNAVSHQQFVRLSGGRIIDISSTPFAIDSEVNHVVDGSGKYLVPGLMDSHVHVGSIPGIGFINTSLAQTHPGLVAQYMKQQPRSFLFHGVTQVLNLGNNAGSETFKQAAQHPDYFTCTPIPVIGGYPDLDAGFTVAHSTTFILEPGLHIDLPENIRASEHTVEAVISRIAKSGSSCIKIYIEDGFGPASDWPLLSSQTMQGIRTQADKHGLHVIAHANAIDMFQIALEHKVDVLAHGLWNWDWPKEKGEPPVNQILDQLMADKRGYMPTIQVMQALQGVYDAAFLADPARKKVLPESLLAWFEKEESSWFKKELSAGFGPDVPDERVRELLGYGLLMAKRATAYLAQHGYPLLLASDYPSSPSIAAAPGLSTYHELLNLSEAGLSNQEIFQAGTLNGPVQFGLSADYGTVEVGKIANLLILEENPLDSVTAWNTIDKVILHGEVIERTSLRADK